MHLILPLYHFTTLSNFMLQGSGSGTTATSKNDFFNPKSLKCLYSAVPSVPMENMLMHVRTGHIKLRGGKGSALTVTIADRVFMSAFASGGKRRIARSDYGVGGMIRRCQKYVTFGIPMPESVDENSFFGGV